MQARLILLFVQLWGSVEVALSQSAPLDCQMPPHLANGDTRDAVKYRYGHNERVEYVCQAFHVMEGQPYKTCIDGEWAGEMRCLRPCTVDAEAMSRRNIQFRHSFRNKLYAAHGDTIHFQCTRGTRHSGAVAMRQRCVDGVMPLPACQ